MGQALLQGGCMAAAQAAAETRLFRWVCRNVARRSISALVIGPTPTASPDMGKTVRQGRDEIPKFHAYVKPHPGGVSIRRLRLGLASCVV